MDEKAYAELKTYLRRLGWALATLPARDRDDIVEETREHVMARVEQGLSMREALAALGQAELYGRRFVDEMEVSSALAGQRSLPSLALLLRRAHRSVAAAVTLLVLLVFSVLALMAIAALVTKPFDPEHVGLWITSRGGLYVGTGDASPVRRELLGNWIYPAAVLDLAVAWFLGRRILLWGTRRQAR